jgi:AbrB family looped-hinge helix DNA binding protein
MELASVDLAKISIRGQLVLPAAIRKQLGVGDGDKVAFYVEDGRVILENAAMLSVHRAQDAFVGEANRLGVQTKQDVVKMKKEARRT